MSTVRTFDTATLTLCVVNVAIWIIMGSWPAALGWVMSAWLQFQLMQTRG